MLSRLMNPVRKMGFILNKEQRLLGLLVIILSFFGAIFETLGVSIIVPLIQAMLDPAALLESIGLKEAIYAMGIDTQQEILAFVALGVVLVYFIKNLYLTLLSYIRAKYSCKIELELSVKMLKSYVDKGYTYFLQNNTADFLRGVDKSVTGVYLVLSQFFKLLVEIMTILCICIYVVSSDTVLAVCIVVLAVLCLGIILLYYRRKLKKCGEEYFVYSSKVNKFLLQTIQGIKEILVMRRQKFFVNNYEQSYRELQKTVVKRNVSQESPAYVIESICVAGLIVSVCVRLGGLENPQEFIPKLGAFAVAAFRILPSLGRISSSFNTCIYYAPCIDDVYNNVKEIKSNEQEEKAPQRQKNEFDIAFKKKITCENLKYMYPESTEYVLDDLNIDIQKGQSIAIIGKSGAGKTTLADIILGLLKPESGNVKVDGINIWESIDSWGKIVGFVPQSVYLLDDTIRNNIAFGIEEVYIDDSKVWEALKQAQLEEMVMNLPKKLDTVIGDRGVRISGGQRQRLAIARALYEDPALLVLDEATSALDEETERAIIESIEYLQGKKTMIIIAHRLTTIKKCDVIYEIVGGTAVQRTRKEVFEKGN